MDPFHVHGLLHFPVVRAGSRRIRSGQGCRLPILIDHRHKGTGRAVLIQQRGSGESQTELIVEGVYGLIDLGIVIGLDEGNGLSLAIQGELVEAIGSTNLGRGENAAQGRNTCARPRTAAAAATAATSTAAVDPGRTRMIRPSESNTRFSRARGWLVFQAYSVQCFFAPIQNMDAKGLEPVL